MSWQVGVLQFLSNLRTPFLNKIFEVITISTESVLLLMIIATVYWCIDKRLGQKLGFILLFSMTANGFIKNLVKAPRPFALGVVEPLRKHTATGYSFPSGHTQAATTFWFVWMTHINKKWSYYTATTMIFLIGLSRLYLGVHWPMDVIAAVGVGIICASIGQDLFKKINHPKKDVFLLGCCFLLWITLFLRFDADYVKTVGGITGFLMGYLIEEKYVSFSTKGSLRTQISKVIIGMVGLVIIYGGIKLVFPLNLLSSFIRYGLIGMWIVVGAPYIFIRLLRES